MKKTYYKLALLTLTLVIAFLVTENSLAQDTFPQRISYQIYNSDDVLVSEGILPVSEAEANSRYNGYSPVTLSNGQYMLLKNEKGKDFALGAGGRITMMFGLNSNGYAHVLINDTKNNNRTLNFWQGYTGGFSFSGSTTIDAEVHGRITNIGSNTYTVNWASMEISY